MPTAISAAAAIAECRAGLGLGGRPESASRTGRRATVRPGHQAAAVAPTIARRPAIAIRTHGRLSRSMRWSTADSSVGAKTSQSPRPAIVPMTAAIVPTTAPLVKSTRRRCFPRGADGGEHAELAEPSLRDDCEACGGNQRCKEEEDGGHGEHRQRLCGAADVVALEHGARIGRAGAVSQGPNEGVMLRLARIDEQVDRLRARRRGRDESELVAQLARVLDDAHDGPSPAVEGQGRPDLEPQRLRHPVGDGDLAWPHRVAAASEREQLAAVGAAGGLRPVIHRLDAARDGHGAVADDVERSERFLGGVERRLELARIGGVEREHLVGRAEVAVVGGNRVVGDRDAADRGGDGDGEERHTRSCCRHSRRNMRPAQRTTARRAATPPFLGPPNADR